MSDDLDELLRLHAAAFRAPWRAETWAVETEAGEEEDIETILSPEEYPSEQVVAQVDAPGVISTPGLEGRARANAAAIAAAHNALPGLVERVRRAEAERDALREVAEAAETVRDWFGAVEDIHGKRGEAMAALRAALAKVPR